MKKPQIDTKGLNEALSQFGSLQEAVLALEAREQALEDNIARLAKEKVSQEKEVSGLKATAKGLSAQVAQQTKALRQLQDKIGQKQAQWDVFEGFVGMLFTSPSAAVEPLDFIVTLQRILIHGWQASKNAEGVRAFFVREVMGNYLRSFRCSNCKAHFIVNREPYFTHSDPSYHCPACHTSLFIEADSSFIEEMMSPDGVREARRAEELEKQIEILKPLEVFLDIPCIICGVPLPNNWSRDDAVNAFKQSKRAHSACWNMALGLLGKLESINADNRQLLDSFTVKKSGG